MSVEDLFKVIDLDFDGFVTLSDLSQFLSTTLGLKDMK